MNNLAKIYYAEGKYAEAEALYKRALAIREKALGSDHPDVVASMNNLAKIYYAEGKYAEAESLEQKSAGGFGKSSWAGISRMWLLL